jgi:hypothetical protein
LGSSTRFRNHALDSEQTLTGSGFVVMDGEEEDFGRWRDSADFVCGLHSIYVRHIYIEKNDARSKFPDLLDGFFSV